MTAPSTLPRYLGYVTLPGWCCAELHEYDSLREAARDLADRVRSVSYNDVPYLHLYRVGGEHEMVDSARKFEGSAFRSTTRITASPWARAAAPASNAPKRPRLGAAHPPPTGG